MTRRSLLSSAAAAGALAGIPEARAAATVQKPNVIVIFADDQGYGDLGCYGSPEIRTPNIDQMARDGTRMTNFYAAPICGPSRAAIMTGCYGPRVGMNTNLSPKSHLGLDGRETTLGSLVKPSGYATMAIGKWHLGDRPQYLPPHRGFDSYYGLPYSADMWPFHPMMPKLPNESPRMTAARKRAEYTGYAGEGRVLPPDRQYPDLPLIENLETIELNPDLTKLTGNYTERALGFIRRNHSNPFLLYLAHNMPHVPVFSGSRFTGKSRRGIYGDAVEEIDWSTGEILKLLRELKIDRRTMVVYTSDNGPWLAYGVDGGSAGPLRDGKGTTWEGGCRVPGIFWWPDTIPAGHVCSEVGATIDLLPTVAEISGAKPPERIIDGRSLLPLLKDPERGKSPRSEHYYFNVSPFGEPPTLQAVRRGEWKLRLTVGDGTLGPAGLYRLEEDVAERFDRTKLEPQIVEDLRNTAQSFYDRLLKDVRPLAG
ncbi:MAG TPA: sulfatase [Bryobacteraceae bacterium]